MNYKLDKNSEIPLYQQLANGIISAIQAGEIEVNSMIPSERSLMETHNISRATIRQAFGLLQKKGYIRKEHGRGSFVEVPWISHNLEHFLTNGSELDSQQRKNQSEVVFFRIILCYPEIAAVMELPPNSYVFKFIRVHSVDGKPALMETTFLPYLRFEGLTREDLGKCTLHELITRWYRTTLTKSIETYEVEDLSESQAALFGVTVGDPAVLKKRLSYAGDQIVEYTIGFSPKGKLTFKVVIEY